MDEFRGEPRQYEQLRDSLQELHEKYKIKSGQLESMVIKEAQKLSVISMTRTDIDKYRKGSVARPRDIRKMIALWNVVYSPEYRLPTSGNSTKTRDTHAEQSEHAFFYSLIKFFDVHKHRNTRLLSSVCGKYKLYHYSEVFYNYSKTIKSAIVVAELKINHEKHSDVIVVEEKQSYDGLKGPLKMKEHAVGYCLPKGPNLCLILKDFHDEMPKFYVFSQKHEDPESGKVSYMRGYMLKSSDSESRLLHFYSPIYAVRVDEAEDIECNILQLSEVDDNIVSELNQGQVIMYGEDG